MPERETTPTDPRLWMWPGMMPILQASGVITPGAVRPDQDRLGPFQRALDLHHVENRDTFRDAADQRHLGVDRLEDRIRGEGRRNVNDRGVGAGHVHRLMNRVEDGQVEMAHPAFAGGHAADHLGAIGDGPCSEWNVP